MCIQRRVHEPAAARPGANGAGSSKTSESPGNGSRLIEGIPVSYGLVFVHKISRERHPQF